MDAVEHGTGAGNSARATRRLSRLVVLDAATIDPGDNPFDRLAAFGELAVHARTPRELVVERARGAEVVLTNKTILDAGALDVLPELRLVSVLATGVNVVDLEAARRRGISVCNVPGYSVPSVTQHVFAMLLAITNAVSVHADAARSGEWAAAPDFSLCKTPLVELAGLTMGIVGHGAIGSAVGRTARAFGMKVLAFSPSRRVGAVDDGFSWATMAQVFSRSDVVSLHCPLTAVNRRFVDAALLATMKEGSVLVNTARGDLIDETALASALDRGRPSWAALDVLSAEPPPPDHVLIAHPRCLVTPHVAWATLAARRRLMAVTVENIAAYAAGNPRNLVTA